MARVLIVEDDPALARLMGDMVSVDGHYVETVADGKAALEQVRQSAFDLVLLDVNLPGHDGFVVCRSMRGIEPAEHRATIIMITGRHDTASKLLAFSMGADDYLVKPIDVRELRIRVARWVELRSEHADIILRRRREAIGEIVAAICHEVNNPLAAAVMGLELVLQRDALPETARRDLAVTRESLDRIDDVLKALLKGVEDRTVSYVGDSRMIDLSRKS